MMSIKINGEKIRNDVYERREKRLSECRESLRCHEARVLLNETVME